VGRIYVNSYYNRYHRRCSVSAPRSLRVKSIRKNHMFPSTTTYKCIYETYMEHILVKLTKSIMLLDALAHEQPRYELKFLSSVLFSQNRPSISISCHGIQRIIFAKLLLLMNSGILIRSRSKQKLSKKSLRQ
jgi:hypothetical protein